MDYPKNILDIMLSSRFNEPLFDKDISVKCFYDGIGCNHINDCATCVLHDDDKNEEFNLCEKLMDGEITLKQSLQVFPEELTTEYGLRKLEL